MKDTQERKKGMMPATYIITKFLSQKRFWKVWMGVVLLLTLVVGSVSAAQTNWIRADDGLSALTNDQYLFRFGQDAYFSANGKLFVQEYNQPCFGWSQVQMPTGVKSFNPAGDYLFATHSDLWWIEKGKGMSLENWNQVTSNGLPSGVSIAKAWAVFANQLYGVVSYIKSGTSYYTFDIYRTGDLGKTTMTWSKVVAEGFGDPQNHSLGYLGVYNNKLIAVTSDTYNGMFGDTAQYLDGIEVWESSTGNLNSWTQVNEDGFGTTVTAGVPKPIKANSAMGAAVEFNGYFYVGTKSHLGAEIWRYDGTGKTGWTNVTPPTLGIFFSSGPGRVESMTVFDNQLYVAEGYPTGNLDRYDGTAWTLVESGPNPFDAANKGLLGLAVSSRSTNGDKLYLYTYMTSGSTQVWGYPFSTTPLTCTALNQATITISPKSATAELGTPGQMHTLTYTVNAGIGADFSDLWVPVSGFVMHALSGEGGAGFLSSNGTSTWPYYAVQGPEGLYTDAISICFFPPAGAKCDTATMTWVDTTAPAITISVPVDGAKYVQNETILADYTAQDAVGVKSTTAPVSNSSPIPTSQPGVNVFTVSATDYGNNTTTKAVTYTVLQRPVAEAGPNQTGLVGVPVSFNGNGSSDPDGTIVSYTWNFGDGSTGTGMTPSHTYTSAGIKTVTLTVTDHDGLTGSDTVLVTVQTPTEGIQSLESEVTSASLPPDIESGLKDKLNDANDALNQGQKKVAINILNSFIKMVNAQRGKALNNAQADAWIAEAQKIIASINAS